MPRLILGIDDAGRGPVIGPMVLAGCLIDKETESEFRRLGVRDSKQLTPKRREFLVNIIKEKSEAYETVLLSPEKIDTSKEEGIKLNELEALVAAKIINKLNKGKEKIKVVIDCPSVSLVKWADYLKMHIDVLKNLEVVCEHKADRNHIAVSAASILAKSRREKAMEKLREEYGADFGSGYPADPKTKEFLVKNATKHKGLFRKSWKTWQKANDNSKQKKLF